MSEEQHNKVFRSDFGKEFRFNDHVCAEFVNLPDDKRTGRLVQVRAGCGKFGSCVYILRLRDGSLGAFENVLMRQAKDKQFEDAFYRSNDRHPPDIPEQPLCEYDTESTEYSILGKWPETGFIIYNPSQPQTHGCFAMTIQSSTGNGVQT